MKKSDKSEIYNHVHEWEHFEHVLSLLIKTLNILCSFNLLDVKYRINIVDLIFCNCCIIYRSSNWSLLLFKETYHIHRCDPSLNHGARALKEALAKPARHLHGHANAIFSVFIGRIRNQFL